MEVTIQWEDDDYFKMSGIGSETVVNEQSIDTSVETELTPTVKAKTPAPLHNQKGLSWFDGTSWGTK
jgi:hypothetical protein